MKHEVPKPSKPVLLKLNEKADRKVDRIAARAEKWSGGHHFSRAYIIHRLIADADESVFADRLAAEAKK